MSNCPDYPDECQSAQAMQRSLEPAEARKLGSHAAMFAHSAKICSYCGLVYVRTPKGLRRMGKLRGEIFAVPDKTGMPDMRM